MELQITQTWYPLSVADGWMDDRTNGWSGPTTEPAFAKATQVKIQRYQTFFYDNGFFLSGGPGPPSNPPPPLVNIPGPVHAADTYTVMSLPLSYLEELS